MIYLFTISSEGLASIWSYAGELIGDTMPILQVFVGVAIGLMVVLAIVKIIKS